ncbi:hypothetical protein [Latilactobacillus sakei]|uniref:hypothetical protein n=1 Tax=Latilactobacillus sakei TaxID=1599 RepID=UPI00345CBEB3
MSIFNFKKYEVNSLATAIYTICSWPSNRKSVGSVDQLNRDFLSYEKKGIYGKRKIKNYRDFVKFYNNVRDKYSNTLIEDLEVDVGQVKFFSDTEQKNYSIFIGNGSENVYESCYIADRLASNKYEDKVVWQSILEYEDQLINSIYSKQELTQVSDDFSCPSQSFFENIQRNYEGFKNPELAVYFRNYDTVNDELYSFFSEHERLPIFLPLMKEVFEEKLELEYENTDIMDATKHVMKERLVNNFHNVPGIKTDYLFKVNVSNEYGERVLTDVIALFHDERCVILVPTFPGSNIKKRVQEELTFKKIKVSGKPDIYNKGYLQISDKVEVKFLYIESTDLSPNKLKMHFDVTGVIDTVSSKDIIGILNHASNIQEIVEFITEFLLKEDTDGIISPEYAGLFYSWKHMDRVINEGAIPTKIFSSVYTQVNANIDFFNEFQRKFPIDAGSEFCNPFHWYLDSDGESDLSLFGKGNDLKVDIYTEQEKYILFCKSNTLVEDVQEDRLAVVQSLDEIINSSFKQHKIAVLRQSKMKYLKIIIVSNGILKQNSEGINISGRYFEKLIIEGSKIQTALVSPNWERISQDSLVESTKLFENELFEDLLGGLALGNISDLELHEDDNDKRTSGMASIQIEYYINPNIQFVVPENFAFRKARRIISKVVDRKQVEHGEYPDKKAMQPLKMFRNELRNELINILNKYDRKLLIRQLLNTHAAILFQNKIHRNRLDTFLTSTNLMKDSVDKFRTRTIKQREDSRQYQLVLEYLIEATEIHGCSNGKVVNEDKLQTIIALAKWILDFQSVADSVNVGITNWISVNIQDDGVVDLIPTNHSEKISNEIVEAKYQFGDYEERDKDVDSKYYSEFKDAFFKDTKLNFRTLLTVLYFLYENGQTKELLDEDVARVYGNVIEADIDKMSQIFELNTEYTAEEFYKILQFVTLDVDNITDSSGFIPTWEKKKRSNKFSICPILVESSKMIYSPAAIYQNYQEWFSGVFNLTLPYQIGMNNTKQVLERWKKEYEKKIVKSISELFSNAKYKTYTNKEIYKLDKKVKHPRDLGDYDVIAIDTEKNVVWIVEVKYLRLNQTAAENVNEQSEYFLSKKSKGNKFLKRVEYFEQNLDNIMHDIGYKGYFELKSNFVANKIVRSQFKDYPFRIMGFNEFKSIVENET